MASITFEQAQKVYGDGTHAVKDLDLDVTDSEFMILVGPSGCGKSTALRMIAGLEEITGGVLRIGDDIVNDHSPKERDIAMVFQSYALYPHMTVAENMGFALKLTKTPKDQIQQRVQETAEILGLTEYLQKKPRALSGGQRQRVAMGRAIVRSPRAFLMDEPLSNLDAKLRVQMRSEIAALQARLQVTTVYVTHDQVEAMTMGDRVAVLSQGRLQQVAPPQELYDKPYNLFVAGFIGSPSMNIASAKLLQEGDDLWIEFVGGTTRIKVDPAATARYPGITGYIGRRLAVGIRPEHFTSINEVPEEQVWRGRKVRLVEMLGSEMLVHFETDSIPVLSDDMREAIDDDDAFEALKRQATTGTQQFVARMEPKNPPREGGLFDVGVDTARLHFFNQETGEALR